MDSINGKNQTQERILKTYSTILLLASLDISGGSMNIDTDKKDWEEIWEGRAESGYKAPRKCHDDVNGIVDLASVSICIWKI